MKKFLVMLMAAGLFTVTAAVVNAGEPGPAPQQPACASCPAPQKCACPDKGKPANCNCGKKDCKCQPKKGDKCPPKKPAAKKSK